MPRNKTELISACLRTRACNNFIRIKFVSAECLLSVIMVWLNYAGCFSIYIYYRISSWFFLWRINRKITKQSKPFQGAIALRFLQEKTGLVWFSSSTIICSITRQVSVLSKKIIAAVSTDWTGDRSTICLCWLVCFSARCISTHGVILESR